MVEREMWRRNEKYCKRDKLGGRKRESMLGREAETMREREREKDETKKI